MKWKKLLSFAIVTVLVFSVLVAFVSPTRADEEGTPIDEINFQVTFEMSDGAAAAAEGDVHLFMHSVDGPVYQGLPGDFLAALDTWDVFGTYNSYLINPAHEGSGTPEALEAETEGWIEDPADFRYLANNVDGDWTVNPFAHNDIRFAFQYLNREEMVEDLLEGFGLPRYGAMAANIPMWEEVFEEPIREGYDMSPEGDWARVEWMVEEAMNEIAEEIPFGELTGSIDDGWYYEHAESETEQHQIEIIIMARIEDWREDWGAWTGDRLEDLGFAVEIDPTPGDQAIPRAFFGTPEPYDNLDYHIYTGGWIATATVFYQEAAINQMHMPWFGFMQNYNVPERYNYGADNAEYPLGPSDRVRDEFGLPDRPYANITEANEEGQELFAGQVVDEADYFEKKVDVMAAGVEEAVRVFAVNDQSFYPYNPDKLLAAVTEATNGYDTFFGPRTMRTDDGRLDAMIMTGEEQPYMDNWNIHGGSADVYGEYQRRLAREYGSWSHPQTGLPMQVNVYWEDGIDELSDEARTDPYERKGSTHTDYAYVEDPDTGELVLEEYIEIPETAVDYVPGLNEWLTIDELQGLDPEDHPYTAQEDGMAAVEVTLDVHEEHVWHDGTDFSLQDLMLWYSRVKELGYEDEDPYFGSVEDANAAWWRSIHAIDWNEEDGTYTVYGDYTFPLEPKLGQYYTFFPETHPLTYYGFDQMHATDDYSYDGTVGDWIHQLIETHSQDMVEVLEDMTEVPAMWTAEANAPMPLEWEDWEARVSNIATFVDERGHSFIGCGPFIIEDYDEGTHDMDISRWADYGYPQPGESVEIEGTTYEFPYGYWSEQFLLEEIRLLSMDSPANVIVGTEYDVFIDAAWTQTFPETIEESFTDEDVDDYRLAVREDIFGDSLQLITSDEMDLEPMNGFTAIDIEGIEAELEAGSYWLVFEIREDELDPWTRIATSIAYDDLPYFEVEITDYDDEVEEGDTVTVDFTVENVGSVEGTQDIVFSVEDTEEDSMEITLDVGETYEGQFTWEAEDEGEYELEVASEDDSDSVIVTVGEPDPDPPDDGIPGFTMALLLVGAVIAVAIYYKKER